MWGNNFIVRKNVLTVEASIGAINDILVTFFKSLTVSESAPANINLKDSVDRPI